MSQVLEIRLNIRCRKRSTEMLTQKWNLLQGLFECILLEKRPRWHLRIDELDVPEETVRRVLRRRLGVPPVLHVWFTQLRKIYIHLWLTHLSLPWLHLKVKCLTWIQGKTTSLALGVRFTVLPFATASYIFAWRLGRVLSCSNECSLLMIVCQGCQFFLESSDMRHKFLLKLSYGFADGAFDAFLNSLIFLSQSPVILKDVLLVVGVKGMDYFYLLALGRPSEVSGVFISSFCWRMLVTGLSGIIVFFGKGLTLLGERMWLVLFL